MANHGSDGVGGHGVQSDKQDESDQMGERGLSARLGDGLSLENKGGEKCELHGVPDDRQGERADRLELSQDDKECVEWLCLESKRDGQQESVHQDLPACLVKNLPAHVVKHLPAQLVKSDKYDGIQDDHGVQGVQEVEKGREYVRDVGVIQGDQLDKHKLHGDHTNSKSDLQLIQHQSDPQGDTGKLKNLVRYTSNSSWFLEPAGGDLRYSDVHTSGGTTLSNLELCSVLKRLPGVNTSVTTPTKPTTTTYDAASTTTSTTTTNTTTTNHPTEKRYTIQEINLEKKRVHQRWRKMVTEKGTFKLVEYCDFGIVLSTNKLKKEKQRRKRKEKRLEEIDQKKLLMEQSEKKRNNFFSNLEKNSRKRKERDENVEEKKYEKKLRSLSTPDSQGGIDLPHLETASEKNMLGRNTTVQLQQGSIEMRSGKLQTNENNSKGVKFKEILSKFEADIPVLHYQGQSHDWRNGQRNLANRRLEQEKEENLGSGHQMAK